MHGKPRGLAGSDSVREACVRQPRSGTEVRRQTVQRGCDRSSPVTNTLVNVIDVDGFVRSLTGVSEHTRRAYEFDATEFDRWCSRGGCPDISLVDARVLRRYLAYLGTRGLARSTIARKAAFNRYEPSSLIRPVST